VVVVVVVVVLVVVVVVVVKLHVKHILLEANFSLSRSKLPLCSFALGKSALVRN
jgi:hypothetical protein